MKKISTLIIVLVALFSNLKAQNYYEGFDSGTMPSDITLWNLDGLQAADAGEQVYNDSAWVVRRSGFFKGYTARANSWHKNDAGPANDWMILPKLHIGADSKLTWKAASFSVNPAYLDGYMVVISTGLKQLADFEANPALFSIAKEDSNIQIRTIKLDTAGYANKDVYIAFVLNTPAPGGDKILIDSIVVTGASLVTTGINNVAQTNEVSISPNPVKNNLRVQNLNNVNQLIITDMTGREIRVIKVSGNMMNIEVADLKQGAYLLSVHYLNGTVETKKFLK